LLFKNEVFLNKKKKKSPSLPSAYCLLLLSSWSIEVIFFNLFQRIYLLFDSYDKDLCHLAFFLNHIFFYGRIETITPFLTAKLGQDNINVAKKSLLVLYFLNLSHIKPYINNLITTCHIFPLFFPYLMRPIYFFNQLRTINWLKNCRCRSTPKQLKNWNSRKSILIDYLKIKKKIFDQLFKNEFLLTVSYSIV
jgi:hypothetical protein